MTNCPNCGAPITGDSCPYCATMFGEPPSRLMIGKTVKVEFEHDGMKHRFDLLVEGFSLDSDFDTTTLRSDDGFTYTATVTEAWEAMFRGHLVPMEHGGRTVFMVSEVKDD